MLQFSEIAIPLKDGKTEGSCLAAARRRLVASFHLADDDIREISLYRKSVDARKKSNVHLTLSVRVRLADDAAEERYLAAISPRDRRRVTAVTKQAPAFPQSRPIPSDQKRPVVVGAGCAGLFAALTLAYAGLQPLLIERGDDASRRSDAIETFHRTRQLDLESNIQFGLGGAGTFSDGKLATGTKNPAHRLILQTLVDYGAPRDILWDAKPHIGSDILPAVVQNIANDIVKLGGEVRFRTRLTDIELDSVNAINALEFNDGERVECSHLILACGHSARDVFELVRNKGIAIERKTFAMGARVEHLQADIDRAQYGSAAGHPALGAAPYSLVAHCDNGRNLFSFCMCPGGQVVAAASETGGVVTNGASLNARAGANANSALLVNITPQDLPGDDPLAGVELQRNCERAAFTAGGSNYTAPAQLVGDFLAGKPSTGPKGVSPTYPLGVTWGTIDQLLPSHVIDTLRRGIPMLDRKLHGFNDRKAVLTGVETRSSSPVQITRDRSCRALRTPGLYPCGEGAGYAGGIMSAATDGIRCAQALIDDLEARRA